MQTTGSVRYDVDGHVATVTLDSHVRLNALSHGRTDDILAHLETAAADDDVWVVVVTGVGKGFCAGGDINAIRDRMERGEITPEEQVAGLRRRQRVSLLLHEMPKVTVAAVNGACAGAGLAIACAADLRIAAESAVFRTAFLTAGMSGDFGASWSLPRIVGPARARELYLFNEKLSARQAMDIGLVNRVHPDATFPAAVDALTTRLVDSPPLTVRAIKRNLNEHQWLGFAEALDQEAERHIRTGGTQDAAEARAAFLEKRQPSFEGR